MRKHALCKRLRQMANYKRSVGAQSQAKLLDEAADEIDRLTEEAAKYHEFLDRMAPKIEQLEEIVRGNPK